MTGKQRLRVLANYLVSGAVDEETFDMGRWPHCAIGEGTRIPSLSKEGLELGGDSSGGEKPKYGDESGYTAVAKFFKISYNDADKYFSGTNKTAMEVGRQLLSYLRRH